NAIGKEEEKAVKGEEGKEDKKEEEVVWENNSEIIGDNNKETANNMAKEESVSDQGTTSDGTKQELASGDVTTQQKQEAIVAVPDSIFSKPSDSEIPSITNITDNFISTSTPSSEPFTLPQPSITLGTTTTDANPTTSIASEAVLPPATTTTPSATSSQAV